MELSENTARTLKVALLTQHGKEQLVAPLFGEFGWELLHTQAVDTDTLGTFSGEVERTLSPRDCAIKKAQLAVQHTDADYGLGSEGSFISGPFGVGTLNHELIACVDKSGELIAIGRHESACLVEQKELMPGDAGQITNWIQALPSGQGFIVQQSGTDQSGNVAKGLTDLTGLQQAIAEWDDSIGLTFTYDLRAHHSPERRKHISLAAQNLVEKLASHCPQCGHIGFWPEKAVEGLPCQWCSLPTRLVKETIATCLACNHEQRYPVEAKTAGPEVCDFCNP